LVPAPTNAPKNPQTNEVGQYSLELLPGSYELFVTSPSFLPWAKRIQVQTEGSQLFGVTLQIPETLTIVETCGPCLPIEMNSSSAPPPKPVASAVVTIAVTDVSGATGAHAQVAGLPSGEDVNHVTAVVETDEDGKLSRKLVPGSYELAVTEQENQADEMARAKHWTWSCK
jgi:hypothetical protein